MIQVLFLILTCIPLLVLLIGIVATYRDGRRKKAKERAMNFDRIRNRLPSKIDSFEFHAEDAFTDEEVRTQSRVKERRAAYSPQVNTPAL